MGLPGLHKLQVCAPSLWNNHHLLPQNLQVHLDEPVIGAGEENISGKNSALDVIRVLVAVRGNSRDLSKVCLILRSLLSCLFLGSLPLTTCVIFRRNS